MSIGGESPVRLDTLASDLPARCLNCDAERQAEYCSRCGQQARDPDPTLWELIAEAWDAFVSVDGKVLASVRLLLLRPGALTEEYLRGRRARYLPPLRLYLVCSVAYFLFSSLTPATRSDSVRVGLDDDVSAVQPTRQATDSLERLPDVARRDSVSRAVLAELGLAAPPGPLDSLARARADSIRMVQATEKLTAAPPWLRERLARGVLHVRRDNQNFGKAIAAQIPRLMFVLMPMFALLLGLSYRSRRKRYPVHLIVALHVHAFIFAALALNVAAKVLPWDGVRAALKLAAVSWILLYLPLALRRVYGGRLRFAVLRAGALWLEYSIMGTLAFAVLAVGLVLAY